MLLVTRIFLYLVSTAPFLVYNIRVTTHLVYTPYIACMCIACTLSRILLVYNITSYHTCRIYSLAPFLVYNSTSYWTKPSSSADLGSSFIHGFAALMLSAHVLSAGSNSNVTTFWSARSAITGFRSRGAWAGRDGHQGGAARAGSIDFKALGQ